MQAGWVIFNDGSSAVSVQRNQTGFGMRATETRAIIKHDRTLVATQWTEENWHANGQT